MTPADAANVLRVVLANLDGGSPEQIRHAVRVAIPVLRGLAEDLDDLGTFRGCQLSGETMLRLVEPDAEFYGGER